MTVENTSNKKRVQGDGVTEEVDFTFRAISAADIKVYVYPEDLAFDDLEDYLLTGGGTDYDISLEADGEGGTVTLVVAPAADEIALIINILDLTQTADLPTEGNFNETSVETALDRLVMQNIQQQEQMNRGLSLRKEDPLAVDGFAGIFIEAVDAADRGARIMQFNEDGDGVEAGILTTDLDTLAGISADISIVAGISANVTTVAGISANVTTVAGLSTQITGVYNIRTDVTTVSGIAAAVSTVSGISASVSTVAGISADVTTVAGISADVSAVAAIAGDVSAVAAIDSDVSAVAAIAGDVSAVAAIAGDVSAVAAIDSDVTTCADNIAAIIDAPNQAASAAASAAAAASSAAEGLYENIVDLTFSDSPYIPLLAAEGTLYRIDTSGGNFVVNLSALLTYNENMKFAFVKVTGDANTITINRGGTDTISGNTSVVLSSQYETHVLVGDKLAGSWIDIVQATGIADGSVTAAKLAATLDLSGKSVTLATGEIGTTELADAIITAAKMASGGIGLRLANGSSTKTISSGAIDISATDGNIAMDTESAAATDDLDTITEAGGSVPRGRFFIVKGSSISRDITLKHGTGNIWCAWGADIVLATTRDIAVCFAYSDGAIVAWKVGPSTATSTQLPWQAMPAGTILDRAYSTYATNADITTILPYDDTIPQNTEGAEILTASITPKSATSRIRVKFQGFGETTATSYSLCAALFIDSTANALCATVTNTSANGEPDTITMEFEHVPGDTSSHTYAIRVGPGASGTVRMNGTNAARLFGGVAISTLILEEIKA